MFSLLDRLLGMPMKEVLDDDPAAGTGGSGQGGARALPAGGGVRANLVAYGQGLTWRWPKPAS
jgi:hypothetical protein